MRPDTSVFVAGPYITVVGTPATTTGGGRRRGRPMTTSLLRRAIAIALRSCCVILAACAAPATGERAAPTPGAAATARTAPAPASLVLRSGRVITVDPDRPAARAIAIVGDRIVAVGSDAEIARHVGPSTRVIDLGGLTAIPGFIEGHGHFTGIGDAMQILDLTAVRNWDEVVDMVAAAVRTARPGEWIRGRGWHQEKWNARPADHVEGFPTHASVSAVSPDNPVALTHASGHAAFFNQKAMDLAGVGRETPDPAGGEILKDERGAPTGVFRETAQGLVSRAIEAEQVRRSPALRREDVRRAMRLADRHCLAHGVTSFQDAGSSFSTIDVAREMAEAGELGVRLWIMVRESNARLDAQLAANRMVGVGEHHLTVRAIKRTIDGALGARGAWLLEPYSDAPASSGLNTAAIPDVEETARLAREHGFQLCVHAIGDRANREVLDLYERAFRDDPSALPRSRWRIEHAQHLSADDIPRFGKLGVIASMQGIHCTSDAPWVEPRLGAARAATGAYVWQSLLRSGAVVTNGTDAPVESVDPIRSYYATVTRRTDAGTQFHPEQSMSRTEALESYTRHAAWAAFEEDLKGSLTPGKLADIVVLSRDITTCPEEQILDTEVVWTIVGGRVRYSRDGRAE